ncbi:MAG: bacillithiol system redox-active protein YtxJ [Acidobacteriota bacterium]|nr:bacillithiol system redox-active protein YtxJ [Acidobacteriota bacterium]
MKANFTKVDSTEKLDELFQKSHEAPVLVFKHSTTCPISAAAYRQIEDIDGEVNIVIVQTARGVSNELANRTGIRHESPQAIVLKDGKPVYHAAHYSVQADEINGKLKTDS